MSRPAVHFDPERMSALLKTYADAGVSREDIGRRLFRGPRWADRLIEHKQMRYAVMREMAVAIGMKPSKLVAAIERRGEGEK